MIILDTLNQIGVFVESKRFLWLSNYMYHRAECLIQGNEEADFPIFCILI
jgi:hypothetical protein